MVLRLANATVFPCDASPSAEDLRRHVETGTEAAEEHGRSPSFASLRTTLDTLAQAPKSFVAARDARLAVGLPFGRGRRRGSQTPTRD